MINVKTSSGFETEINEDRLKDWRLVKRLSALQALEKTKKEGVELEFVAVMADIERLLFDDEGEALESFIAENNEGSVPTDILLKDLIDCIKSNEKTKN